MQLVYVFILFVRQLQSSHVRPIQLVVPSQGAGGRGGRGQGDCIYGERGQGEDPEHQLQQARQSWLPHHYGHQTPPSIHSQGGQRWVIATEPDPSGVLFSFFLFS